MRGYWPPIGVGAYGPAATHWPLLHVQVETGTPTGHAPSLGFTVHWIELPFAYVLPMNVQELPDIGGFPGEPPAEGTFAALTQVPLSQVHCVAT